jgi:hypothetical protein
MFSGESIVAAVNLKEFIVGGAVSLIWLIKKSRGKKPDRIERVSDSHVMIVIGAEEFTVPLELMRLYQDIAVRSAVPALDDLVEARGQGVWLVAPKPSVLDHAAACWSGGLLILAGKIILILPSCAA